MSKKQSIQLSTIISKCKEQDPTAQRRLYDMYVLRLYNVAYRIVYSREDAEDAVHQAFRKAFAKIDTYNVDKGHMSNWLNRICVNESITIIKKRKLKFNPIEDQLTIASSAPSKLDHMEAEYIYKAISRLPEQQRIIFNLYEIEGYTHKEIADMLGSKESTCRAYLTRAKSKLRELLSREFPNQVKVQ